MKNLLGVVWTKGMLLTPQHFQSQANFVQDTVDFRLRASLFENWGISSLSCDEEGLVNGSFSIRNISGILPDGETIEGPSVDELPAARQIEKHFPTSHDILDVYLCLAQRGHSRSVCRGNDETNSNCRYTARVRDVWDENSEGEEKPVEFAYRNFVILFGTQNRDGFSSIRIAQITRNSTGQYCLNPDFIPPLLNTVASPALLGLLKRQIELLAAKGQAIAGARHHRGNAAEFHASDAASFWLLHTVNSFLPEMIHLHESKRGHPEPLFVVMLRLAGAMSTFSAAGDPRGLPVYDHDALSVCFGALDAKIRDLLETVIPSKCIAVNLRQDQRIWNGGLSEEHLVKNAQLILCVSGGLAADEIIRRVPQLVKIAPQSELANLISYGLPALPIRHLVVPPPSVPFRMENQYFQVSQVGRFWDGIVQSKLIGVYIPPEFAAVRPELVVVLP